jgi:hypothetical protein
LKDDAPSLRPDTSPATHQGMYNPLKVMDTRATAVPNREGVCRDKHWRSCTQVHRHAVPSAMTNVGGHFGWLFGFTLTGLRGGGGVQEWFWFGHRPPLGDEVVHGAEGSDRVP